MTGAATDNKDPRPLSSSLTPSSPVHRNLGELNNLRGEDVTKTFSIIFVTPGQEALIKLSLLLRLALV